MTEDTHAVECACCGATIDPEDFLEDPADPSCPSCGAGSR